MGNRHSIKDEIEADVRNLRAYIRELDRDIRRLEREERDAMFYLQNAARKGNMAAVKSGANRCIKYKHNIAHAEAARDEIMDSIQEVKAARTRDIRLNVMKTLLKIAQRVNQRSNLKSIHRLVHEYEHERELADVLREEMDDALDNSEEVDDEEAQELIARVLDEAGIEHANALENAPLNSVLSKARLDKYML